MNSKIRDKLNWMINIKQPCLYWLQGSYRTAPKLKLFEIILLNWGCIVDSESSHFSPTIFFFNLLHIFYFIVVHFWNMQNIDIFQMTILLSGLFLLITKGNLSDVSVGIILDKGTATRCCTILCLLLLPTYFPHQPQWLLINKKWWGK